MKSWVNIGLHDEGRTHWLHGSSDDHATCTVLSARHGTITTGVELFLSAVELDTRVIAIIIIS